MFKKILIANRGEIAVRIIRACREMNIRTVAVCSEADRSALHVLMADEAVCVGGPAPLDSYLNMERILEAAGISGAEAIHPGYGFLAENHRFAARCGKQGLVFIGPGPDAMKLVGDKVASRKTLSRIDVPVIPGMKAAGASLKEFEESAKEIGYPVMVKASAGGGGKGMRVARHPAELRLSVEAGMREAKAAFGDESVYLEKCIERPRHIEFQVLADHHGNAVHVFERECSIQRRHQKIIEESPSPFMDEELRRRMGDAAVAVVRETGYTNAGTVEFLVDENRKFYFLEVNARIQVEHPVTEMVTGTDLVKWQIRIASGERLTLKQKDLRQRGHALECRIYAEDPANGFLPCLGKIHFMKNPEGPGVRVDSGIYSGYEVTRYYDPILAKLIVWGEQRSTACSRMVQALSDYVILGIQTTIPYLMDVLTHPDFLSGKTYTDFIQKNMPDWTAKKDFLVEALAAASIQDVLASKTPAGPVKRAGVSPWQTLGAWRLGGR
ncbi:MAG TPA: acetyl-CoA carboxylase biotin carboxylase subunit [bacterium]|nr:acetyl-CoA carboxylase biotin carboxylase subunit [bacterium]